MGKEKSTKGGSRGPNVPITKDERFSSVHNDPRFKMPKSKQLKVKIDERFSKKDLEGFNSGAKIDRYGRKLKKEDKNKDFDKYYEKEKIESEDEDESEDADSEDNEEEEVVIDEDENVLAELDRARGEGLASDSEDESGSDVSSSDSESEEEEGESEIELEENKPDEGEPSSTFAVVNLDWDNIKSVDLLATFSSFVPADGKIVSVAIYPSEFGKERMQKEEIEGPPRDLFKKKKQELDSDSDDDSDLEAAAKKLYEQDDGKEDYDSRALRKYQLQRLRYYYAIVKCDSVSTSKKIYDSCDGTEYESTANMFDLRYVPEGMEFDDEPRDKCGRIPSNYKPNNFVTDALQHSKVKLTWDETPAERLKMSGRAFSQKEIDEMDFKAYLASDSDGSDEGEGADDMKNKYKNLLDSSTKIGSKSIFDDKNDEDDIDMEITFNPGLNGQEAETKEPEEESTIDAFRRKEKERRKRRMEKLKEQQKQTEDEKKQAIKSLKENRRKKNNGEALTEDDKRKKAELELLMMDEEENDQEGSHFNMKEIIKNEKQKGKKNKKGKKKQIDSEVIQDNFKPDLNDPRFAEVFENHDFAIDPTRPEFKKTETMTKIIQESSKRHNKNKGNKGNKRKYEETGNDGISTKSLVDKIKKRSRK